jgi:hypothetical protein
MLIDHWMPEFETSTHHRVDVAAPADRVWAALHSADLGAHPVVRTLLLLRALPAALAHRKRRRRLRTRARQPLTLAAFEAQRFRILEEEPPRELVIGLEGAFWRPGGGLRAIDAAAFRGPIPAGIARVAWNFAIEPVAGARCVLTTETRIATGDAAARRRFRAYWWLVRPGSGLIRRFMLYAVRAEAERATAAAPMRTS